MNPTSAFLAYRLDRSPASELPRDSLAPRHLPPRLADPLRTYRLDWRFRRDLPSRLAGFPRRNRPVEAGSRLRAASRGGKSGAGRPVDPGSDLRAVD